MIDLMLEISRRNVLMNRKDANRTEARFHLERISLPDAFAHALADYVPLTMCHVWPSGNGRL